MEMIAWNPFFKHLNLNIPSSFETLLDNMLRLCSRLMDNYIVHVLRLDPDSKVFLFNFQINTVFCHDQDYRYKAPNSVKRQKKLQDK